MAAVAEGKISAPVDFTQMEHEIAMNKELHLVPCRWERSGWRYVQRDPAGHQFFNNPNRVNNFGVAPERRRFVSQQRESFYKTGNRSAFSQSKNNGAHETTYGRSFV